jgi:hypothetical protein
MMTRQTRHQAARGQSSDPDAGLPGHGQALIGYPEPERSLFGVPQSPVRRVTPPRPRIPQDDHPPRQHRHRVEPPKGRTPQKPSWGERLGLPLAVVTLGVTLGVITVVMLAAAGVPIP